MKTQKMNGDSHNPQAELLAKLQKEMPEIFSEGKIDFSKFKATLGEDSVADGERYGLSWAGKNNCFRQIQEATTNTLKPHRDESVNFDDTENLFIEGDNLQVMKVLQKSYYGKVKMIYIDPPYNTGNDFIYNDKFSQAKREYLQEIGAIDELGNVVNAELYRQNTRDSGHFHSTWMNMMYPRLFLARNLLRQDGVIFVSIDDNEMANLRKMMDEIFGEENFVAQFVWKSRRSEDDRKKTGASVDHEYILCYQRSENAKLRGTEKDLDKFSNPDNDSRGPWRSADMTGLLTRAERPNCHYDLENPETGIIYKCPPKGWRYDKNTMSKKIQGKRVLWPKDPSGRPRHKLYQNELNSLYKNISSVILKVSTFNGTKELNALLGIGIFAFPKPVDLLKIFVEQGTSLDDNDIVLDFFAGSGSLAHAVMQLNAEDSGNRKWISVQLPEKCKEKSEAAKAGYVTIADIAKERIRRAGKQILQKVTSGSGNKNGEGFGMGSGSGAGDADGSGGDNEKPILDLGFKVFKLEESNFKVWNTQIENVEQLEQQMLDFIDNVREGATSEDLLYELILKSGKELNVPIEEKKADGQSYFRIGDGTIIICLADKLTKPLFEAITKDKPEKIITLDRAFGKNDQLKTNILLQAENAGVKEFKVI